MSAPSERAVKAAAVRLCDPANPNDCLDLTAEPPDTRVRASQDMAQEILDAAHNPTLGLDRSVCLRDVVEAVRYAAGHIRTMSKEQTAEDMADFIERTFTDDRE